MNQPLGVGVIGIGFGQQAHVPAFRSDGRCQVKAIAGRSRDRAQAVADRLAIPHALGDWRDLIEHPEVDIVSIAVPPIFQPEIALAAIQAGRHLFCEKPAALHSQAARELLDAARAHRVVHGVDFLFRAVPALEQARRILHAGRLGPIRHALVNWKLETYAYRTGLQHSWKLDPEQGGGSLLNFVSHEIDTLLHWLGPIDQVAAWTSDNSARADLWLRHADGAAVSLSVAADAFLGSGHHFELHGRDGTLTLHNSGPDHARGWALHLGTRESNRLEPWTVEDLPVQDGDGRISATARLVRRFLDAVLGGPAMEPDLADALRVQQVLDAALDARATRTWVRVKGSGREPAS